MSTKREVYVATQEMLADAIGITRPEWSKKWSSRPGCPPKTAKGWPVHATMAWHGKWLADDAAKKQSGPNADLKRRKLAAEAEIGEVKLAAMKGELIPESEHLIELQELCQMLQDGLAQAVAMVRVQTKDAKLVAIVEQMRDETLRRIADKCAPPQKQ